MAKGSRKRPERTLREALAVAERAAADEAGRVAELRRTDPSSVARVADLAGAKKVKKKCCRSTPRCKGCPVVLMRTARLADAGVSGKDLKKAIKRARAA